MPIYQITGKNGVIYRVNGPAGLSKEQVIADVLGKHPEAGVPPQEESAIESIPVVGGILGQVADYPARFVEGLAGIGEAGAEAFGPESGVANFFENVAGGARALRSKESRESEMARSIRSQLAEKEGTGAQVGAAVRNFLEAPLETTAQVAGSAIPFIAAGAVTGGTAVPVLLGAGVGAGTVKGAIYDATYEEFKKAGASEAQAKAAAEKAQEYGGENIDQIGLGAVIGGLASGIGFEPAIARTLGKVGAQRVAANLAAREAAEAAGTEIAKKSVIRGGVAGVGKEAIPEAFQGGQERYAANLALQRQGFDVDPWEGVAGQAAAEGVASIILGGYGGVRETQQANAAATAKQYAAKVEALPDNPTDEDVGEIAQWALRRGFSEEEASIIGRNAAEQKARVAKAKADMEAAKQAAVEARTAGIEPSAEPDITAPGMPPFEEELTAPPVDLEEQAAMERAYAEEAGFEPITPESFVDRYMAGEGRGNTPADLELQQYAANNAAAVEAEFAKRTPVEPAAPVRRTPQPVDLTPERAGAILSDPVALSDYEASGGDVNDLYDIAEGGGRPIKYSRRAKDTQTEDLFGALPVQQAPGEELKREEFNLQRFAPEEQKAAIRAQAAAEVEAGTERATALQQREAEQREETLGDIEYALRAQAPENAVYKVEFDPKDVNPYRLVAETQLGKKPEEVIKAKTLQDFSDQVYGRMMELTPYIPPAPAAIEEIETTEPTEQEAPTVATRMVQDFTAEVDAAREAGKIDNNQRSQLLQRLQRPNAYRTLPNGRQVPNDAIAKLEAEALEAASVARNASAEEAEAAQTALAEANQKLRTAVKNSLLNPARATLKSMVEMRQDERVGAKVRIKEAQREVRAATRDMRKEMKPGKGILEADITPERERVTEAKKEIREAKIDLAQQKVQKYRKAQAKGGIKADAVQRVVDKITKQWKSANPVVVVQSINDIADAKVLRAIRRDGATDAEGLVAPDGTIYLIADNLGSEARAKAVLFHEGLGHVGLEKLFRDKLDNVLKTLYNSNAKLRADTDAWIKANPDAYKNDTDPLARAVEEVLAERSEAGRIEPSIFGRLAAVVRNFARRLGINLAFSNADVEAILAAAHERTVNGPNESQLVKGMRYVGGDRVVIDPVAAKTFLKELGVFNNRELMEMSGQDVVRAAHNIGVDQEWLDYYRSQRLAAWAPQGAEPIKLPQPDMSKYMPKMPKFSRKKTNTSKADAKKLDKADERMSVGARKVNKSFSTAGMAEGLEDMAAGHSFKDWAGSLWSNWDLFSPSKRRYILKTLPSSGILGWLKPEYPVLHAKMLEIDERVHKMNALKQRILAASDDLARDIRDFADEYGTDALATLMGHARINEQDPYAFADVDAALSGDAVMQEIEKSILKNSNNTVKAQELIDAIKTIVMENKDSVKVKGDKYTMSALLLTKVKPLEGVAKDQQAVRQQVEQLAEMTRRIRDTYAARAVVDAQRGGAAIYKEMRQFYKDMFEAELALLEERINSVADEEEAVRIKDMRAKLMREAISPEERKKGGDIFWNIDADLFQKDYFPFMRDGDRYIRVLADKGGTREREFHTFRTDAELRAAQKKIAERLGVDPEDSSVLEIGYDISELQENLRTEDAIMQRVFDIVGKARTKYEAEGNINLKELTDSIYQTWLMTTPERSVRRRLMHAEEVVGFSPDVFLHFREQATTYANQLSKLAYAGQIRMAVEEARDVINDEERPVSERAKLRMFVKEFEDRADDEMNPDPQNAIVNLLNRSSYLYYLTSAKTALLQTLTIPIRVVPRLWRDYGYVKGTGMWLKYMKMWNSLGRVKTERGARDTGEWLDGLMPSVNGSDFVKNSADLQWAMKMGMERGILETLHDTLVQNERATPGKTATGMRRKAEDAAALTAKAMSFLFNGMENISRQASYYMTFELALEKYRNENKGASDAEARDYAFRQAMDVVRNTAGDFSSWERPSIAKGNIGRAVFLFKMHPITQTRFMVGAMRDIITDAGGERAGALKELSGVLMMTGLFGGVMGMPLYSAMTYALMAAFGPDEEDDEDVLALMGGDPRTAYDPDIAFRSWMNDKFGDIELAGMSLADILVSGPISTALNTELTSATSLDLKNMWFRDAVVGDSLEDTMVATAIANITGLSMVSQMLRGYESFKEGKIEDGLKKMLPAFFRTWFNAAVNEEQGIKNRRGDVLIPKEDISAADNIRDVLGFRAPKLSRIQQYYITRARKETAIKAERTAILDRLETAYNNGEFKTRKDYEEFRAKEIIPFNRTYPDREFLITDKAVQDSLKRRAGIRARTFEGVQFDKKTMGKDVAAQERFVQ